LLVSSVQTQISALTTNIFFAFISFKSSLLKIKSIIIKIQEKIKEILAAGATIPAGRVLEWFQRGPPGLKL
jgi:hypothetical protein